MLTPVQQRAILYNLPNLVADLDVFDVMDHLIATTPTCLTPTDYESITTIAHQKGRAAGVRSLVTCLLRRPLDSPVFAAFCSALREQYSHLADLLEHSLQRVPESSEDIDCPVSDSQLNPTQRTGILRSVLTPCQTLTDFTILEGLVSLGFSKAVYNTILLIIITVSSHPWVILRWKALCRELGLTEKSLQQIDQSESSSSDQCPSFPQATAHCRRALCMCFNIRLTRSLESHGSPFKRVSATFRQDSAHFPPLMAKRFVECDLIPALERIECWKLASSLRSLATLLVDSVAPGETSIDRVPEPCALRLPWMGEEVPLAQQLLERREETEHMLNLCTRPLFKHALVNLNWPFILRELQVCSACVLCLLHSTPCRGETTIAGQSDSKSVTSTRFPCELSLATYLHTALISAMHQQELLHHKSTETAQTDSSRLPVARICKASVASVVHGKLLPVLRNFDLNALSDDVEQTALEVLH